MEVNLKNFQVTDTIHGTMVSLKNDAVLGQWLKKYGEWSQGENIIMSKFVSKGDIVIDIGANIGTTCLLYTSPSPRDAHESRMPSSA